MLRLEATYGERLWTRKLRSGHELRIGAEPDNDLYLPVPGVSRYHAVLRSKEQGWELSDLGSKNLLIQAGYRCQRLVLRPGEPVQVGRAFLCLREIETAEGELGLVVADSSSSGSGLPGSETETLENPGAQAAARVLELLARFPAPYSDGDLSHETLWPAVQQLLQASALCELELTAEGPIFRRLVGPSTASLTDLDWDALRDADEPVIARADGDLLWACVTSQPDRRLLAMMPAQEYQGWHLQLLRYLAAQRRTGGESAPMVTSRSRPALQRPQGLVLGNSPSMEAATQQLEAALAHRLPVLLLGETGVGKEVFAELLHRSVPGAKGDRPFVACNCAAIPGELLEAELFGTTGGVATGVSKRNGRFLQANGGTLLLDEVGELPALLQAKLLRVLGTSEVQPLGGDRPLPIQVRVVSATNRDLDLLVRSGKFREDLFYRLCGHIIQVPPLRDRREDIPELALLFLQQVGEELGKRIAGISRGALQRLIRYPWPGNVRQLKSEITRAVAVCPDGGHVESQHLALPELVQTLGDDPEPSLAQQVAATELRAITRALAQSEGNLTRTAELLKISRQGLRDKMGRLGLTSPNRND